MNARSEPLDVMFILPHLGPGGAQRVVSVVAEHLIEDGRSVAVMTLIPRRRRHDLPGSVLQIEPPAVLRFLVPLVQAARSAGLRALPPSVRGALAARRAGRSGKMRAQGGHVALPWTDRLRRRRIAASIRRLRPTGVVSLLTKTNVLTLLATEGMETRVVISERNRLVQHQQPDIRRLRAHLYPSHPLVTANSTTIVNELRADLGVHHARLLPNVIRALPPEVELATRPKVVSVVARLVPQKRVELALQAFSSLHEHDPEWTLQIVGDGPEATNLRRLATDLIPDDRYQFLGHLHDPTTALRRSRILIHPSAFEGTPNALLEAMAFGVVPLASEESDPAGELIMEGLTGRRFGNRTRPIAAQLVRLATQDDLAMLAGHARGIADRFTWKHQREPWEAVLFGGHSE